MFKTSLFKNNSFISSFLTLVIYIIYSILYRTDYISNVYVYALLAIATFNLSYVILSMFLVRSVTKKNRNLRLLRVVINLLLIYIIYDL